MENAGIKCEGCGEILPIHTSGWVFPILNQPDSNPVGYKYYCISCGQKLQKEIKENEQDSD